MTTDQCRHMRSLLGLHALHRLDDAEATRLRAHLDGCPDCRAELRELRTVTAALDQADPDRLGEPRPAPPAALRRAIFTELARDRHRRRAHTIRLVGAAAALVLVLVVGGWIGYGLLPHGRALTFAAAPSGVHATASVEPRDWGTRITLDVAGLPQGQRYLVWLERPDGTRMPAGSFLAGGDRTMSLQLAAGLPMSDATTLGISTPTDQHPILQAPIRQ